MPGNLKIALVVAVAQNNVIGAKGGLPWKLSTDLKRFKQDTMGKVIIMGRKTWESIGKPLPGRTNIVVTRQKDYHVEGADVVFSLKDGLTLAEVRHRCLAGENEVCIIGGGELYAQALPMADKLYVTHVLAEPEGDTRFPEIHPADWEAVSRQEISKGERDSADTLYVVYQRKSAPL